MPQLFPYDRAFGLIHKLIVFCLFLVVFIILNSRIFLINPSLVVTSKFIEVLLLSFR